MGNIMSYRIAATKTHINTKYSSMLTFILVRTYTVRALHSAHAFEPKTEQHKTEISNSGDFVSKQQIAFPW